MNAWVCVMERESTYLYVVLMLWLTSINTIAAYLFLFVSLTPCISVCALPKSRCSGFKKHVCQFFGSLDFVSFDTVPISFSLMSPLRDSKEKRAILASRDRRLANNSLLPQHTISLFSCSLCVRPNSFYQWFNSQNDATSLLY